MPLWLYLWLLAGCHARKPQSAEAPPIAEVPPAVALEPGETWVRETAPDHFEIARGALAALVSPDDPASLGARVLPFRGPDGVVVGVRVNGLQPESPLRELGLQDGDILHSLGPYPLTGVSAGLEAWEGLEGAPGATLSLTRGSDLIELRYTTVDFGPAPR